MTIPHAAKYARWPTRTKVQFFWASVCLGTAGWQLTSFLVNRVTPKRREQMHIGMNEHYPDGDLPEGYLKKLESVRALREMTSIQNSAMSPSTGEFIGAASRTMDTRSLGALRKE